jgi:hypothetical protein
LAFSLRSGSEICCVFLASRLSILLELGLPENRSSSYSEPSTDGLSPFWRSDSSGFIAAAKVKLLGIRAGLCAHVLDALSSHQRFEQVEQFCSDASASKSWVRV